MNKRDPLLDVIRHEERKVALQAERLHQASVRRAARASELLSAAGRAGPMGKAVRVWLAERLERKANAGFALLRQRRQLIKAASETVDHGHRSARRQMDRESS